MPNAVIYARYSSDKQTEQSIEGQLRTCYAYAAQQGYAVIGEYIDRAKSAKNDDREQFQRMIADSSKKQFQFIIVYKLDRFSRNRYDSAIYKRKLSNNGVKVVSATEPISDTGESRIVEALFEAMAEEYLVTLSDNVKRGMRESALNGKSTGGNIPFGYTIKDKRLSVDERLQSAVKWIFEAYAAGQSKTEIVKELQERGLRSTRGNPFTINNLTIILNNPMYTGKYTYKGEFPRECPAIISAELFNKCKERSAAGKKLMGRKPGKVDYLLTGKLFCGHCGDKMTGDCGTSRNGEVHYYYNCHTRKRLHTCKKKPELKDYLEWYVVEQTAEYVLDPQRLAYIAEKVVEQLSKESDTAAIKTAEKDIALVDKEITECAGALCKTTSKAALKIINERLIAAEYRKETLETDIARLKNAAAARVTAPEIETWLKTFCKGDPLDDTFRRRIIDTFVNSVYLYDDKVIIYYNVKDCEQISYIEMLESTEDITFPDAPPGSDSPQLGEPERNQSEHVLIFVRGLFGTVAKR